jgi:hypothetical protein
MTDMQIQQMVDKCKKNPATCHLNVKRIGECLQLFLKFTGVNLHGLSLNLALWLVSIKDAEIFIMMYDYCLGKNLSVKEAKKYYREHLLKR